MEGGGGGGGLKQSDSLGCQFPDREFGGQAGNNELTFAFGDLSNAVHITFMLFQLHIPATQVKASTAHQPALTSFVVTASFAFAFASAAAEKPAAAAEKKVAPVYVQARQHIACRQQQFVI